MEGAALTPGAPCIVERSPGPGDLAPACTRTLSIAFDRAMDRSRGRVRLVWGRITAHVANAGLRHWRFDLRDGALAWSADGGRLTVTLPAADLAGFVVRVEWEDLACATTGLSPVPEGREEGASYVVTVARDTPWGGAPSLACLPAPGPLRRDPILELYADRPVVVAADGLRLSVGGRRVPFELRTNRNPPDWRFLQPTELLPPQAEVTLEVGEGAVRATDGVALPARRFTWVTTAEPPAVPAPEPSWSEPVDGTDRWPTDVFEASLRFPGRPHLSVEGRVRLLADGREVPGVAVDHWPTPGHYRTVFVRGTRAFPGLPTGARISLEWQNLAPDGYPPGPRGRVTGTTVLPGEVPRPVVLLGQAFSAFATPSGTWLQPVVTVATASPVVEAEVEGEGWRIPLVAARRPGFTDVLRAELRSSRLVFLEPPQAALTRLPPAAEPGNRAFRVRLRTQAGDVWRKQGHVFDMTPRAVLHLHREGHRLTWSRTAHTDSQYVCVLRPDGLPLWAGLFPADVGAVEVPRGVVLPDDALTQVWLVRARPEDDLWDYAVVTVAGTGERCRVYE